MILWLDNQLPPALAAWMRASLSVDCVPVRDLQLQRATDSEIFHAARAAQVVVVTKDADFVDLADFLRSYFSDPPDVVKKKVLREFENLTFYVKDEDGEGSVTADSTELVGEPALVSVDTETKTVIVQMVFRVSYHGHIVYRDSSSGVRDGDTILYQDNLEEEVSDRKTKITVEVTAMFDGLDPSAVDEEETSIVKPADGVYFIPTNESREDYK